MTMSHVLTNVRLVTTSPFAFDHAVQLAAFQTQGDDRFLWGLDKSVGAAFYLEEDQAHAQHQYVNDHVVCPLPGCAAKLTTVHSTVKRDHLRHLGSTGGHGLESLFHSQGCSLIQAWLATKYPLCHVKREGYTSPEGESRADVLITHPSRLRVAFEVQYSPLTNDAWTERHRRYEAREVRDVWLFGHTTNHLKLDDDGHLKTNPALAAVAATGAPLFFINPITEQLAIAIARRGVFSAELGGYIPGERVPVLGGADGSSLEMHDLTSFRLGDPQREPALTSDRINELIRNAIVLDAHNDEQRRLYARQQELARKRAEAQQATREDRLRKAKERREQQADEIRAALDTPARWGSEHPAMPLIAAFVEGRAHRDLGTPGDLEQWKCVAYFFHVAIKEQELFTTKTVADTLYKHRIRLRAGMYKTIGRWLHALVDAEFLFEGRGDDGFPVYKPTYAGAWW